MPWDSLKENDYIFRNDNMFSTLSKCNTIYSQFMPLGEHSPIATGWCISGEWMIHSTPKGELVFIHQDLKDKPSKFTFEQIVKMHATGSIQRIHGYELKYHGELIGFMGEFINDQIRLTLSE